MTAPDTGWWKSIYLVICAAAALFIVYKKWRELKQMNKKQNDWISLSVGGLTAIVMRSGGYMEESSLLLLRQLCSELQFGNTDAVVNMAQHVYGQPRVNRSFYTNYVKVYHTYPHRLSVMNTMYQVAKTGGSINEDTWQLLMEIGNELLITPATRRNWLTDTISIGASIKANSNMDSRHSPATRPTTAPWNCNPEPTPKR